MLVKTRVGNPSSTGRNTLDERVASAVLTKWMVALRAHTVLSKELQTLLLLLLIELLLAGGKVWKLVILHYW